MNSFDDVFEKVLAKFEDRNEKLTKILVRRAAIQRLYVGGHYDKTGTTYEVNFGSVNPPNPKPNINFFSNVLVVNDEYAPFVRHALYLLARSVSKFDPKYHERLLTVPEAFEFVGQYAFVEFARRMFKTRTKREVTQDEIVFTVECPTIDGVLGRHLFVYDEGLAKHAAKYENNKTCVHPKLIVVLDNELYFNHDVLGVSFPDVVAISSLLHDGLYETFDVASKSHTAMSTISSLWERTIERTVSDKPSSDWEDIKTLLPDTYEDITKVATYAAWLHNNTFEEFTAKFTMATSSFKTEQLMFCQVYGRLLDRIRDSRFGMPLFACSKLRSAKLNDKKFILSSKYANAIKLKGLTIKPFEQGNIDEYTSKLYEAVKADIEYASSEFYDFCKQKQAEYEYVRLVEYPWHWNGTVNKWSYGIMFLITDNAKDYNRFINNYPIRNKYKFLPNIYLTNDLIDTSYLTAEQQRVYDTVKKAVDSIIGDQTDVVVKTLEFISYVQGVIANKPVEFPQVFHSSNVSGLYDTLENATPEQREEIEQKIDEASNDLATQLERDQKQIDTGGASTTLAQRKALLAARGVDARPKSTRKVAASRRVIHR